MEVKKNLNADLEKKSSLFLNIGLCVSLLLVITAFEWKFYDRGAGNYESQRLSNQIIGTPIKEYLDNYKGGSIEKIIQSARMAYVGFSRPTHLLCFAINNVRAKNLIDKIDKTEWDVIEIKKNDKVEDS